MSDANRSKAAAEAVQFLTSIHEDLRALLASLHAAIEQAGWKAASRKISDLNLNATMNGGWLLSWGYHVYTPTNSGDRFQRLVVVVWSFNLPESREYDQAALTVVAARFSRPVTLDEVYDSWETTLPITIIGLHKEVVSTLSLADYEMFVPQATAAAGGAWPLCSFTGEADLLERVVNPILAAEAKLGAQP